MNIVRTHSERIRAGIGVAAAIASGLVWRYPWSTTQEFAMAKWLVVQYFRLTGADIETIQTVRTLTWDAVRSGNIPEMSTTLPDIVAIGVVYLVEPTTWMFVFAVIALALLPSSASD